MIKVADLPAPDLTGWRVVPDLVALRAEYRRDMGQQRGDYAADALRVTGWTVAFDMRNDGLTDGFICERKLPDGGVQSVSWNAHQLHSIHPPLPAPAKGAKP